METNRNLSLAARIVVEPETRSGNPRERAMWLAALGVSGLGGIGSGIVGLLLSFLTAQEVIPASSSVRITVPVLIVASLALLMCTAHCLDRIYQMRK